jgi:hypothetical protein
MEFPKDLRDAFKEGHDLWADFVMLNDKTTVDEKINIFIGLKQKAKYEFMYKCKTYDLAMNMLIENKVKKGECK